jgi:uncharacterized membrane protein
MQQAALWRTELWHPLVLHFPLVLLLVATAAKLIAFLFRTYEPVSFWQRAGSYLLYAGWLTAWLAIYTGDLADGIVSRKICDPTVLKEHEITAYYASYLFTGAVAADLSLRLLPKYLRPIRLLELVLLLAGAGYLGYAGHLGAQVVYQQGGGVRVPAADCADYAQP